jgi:hypothetical protein
MKQSSKVNIGRHFTSLAAQKPESAADPQRQKV